MTDTEAYAEANLIAAGEVENILLREAYLDSSRSDEENERLRDALERVKEKLEATARFNRIWSGG